MHPLLSRLSRTGAPEARSPRRRLSRPTLAALLLVALLPALPSCALHGGSGGAPGSLAAQDYLYVALQGEAKVAVVNMETLEEVARVDLTAHGFSENASPHHIAVDPDGSHWYVSLISENRVVRFDRNNQMVGQAAFDAPGLMVRAPQGSRLYVGRSMMAANPPRSVGEITVETMAVEEVDVFFPRPHALELAPGRGQLYTASLSQNQMGAMNVESLDLALTNLDGDIHTVVQFAVSPDGRTLVGTGEVTGLLLVHDLSDPAAPVLRQSIEVGGRPWHPVFEPGGERVWMGLKGGNEVVAVDLARGEVIHRISDPRFDQPHGAAISRDGRYLFVSSSGPAGMPMDGSMDHGAADHGAHAGHGAPADASGGAADAGSLAVIDLATHEVVRVLPMGRNTTGIGMRRP